MVLYVPDQVTQELYYSFINDTSIREVLMKIKSADIVIHGIGDAMIMAKRRKTSESEMKILKQGKAITCKKDKTISITALLKAVAIKP